MLYSALLTLAFIVMASFSSNGLILETLQATEEQYRKNINTLSRVQNVDILTKDLAVCRLVEMNRHSIITDNKRIAFPLPFPRQVVAAIALAMEHLNSGNGVIVSELNGLNETCKIRFIAEFLDTAGEARETIQPLNDILRRDVSQPCAFIGAFLSTISVPTSLLTGIAGYPQITALSTSPELNDKSRFPLFGRIVPSADQYGAPLLRFLRTHWNIRHLGVFYSTSEVGLAYLSGFQIAATQEFPEIHLHPISFTFPTNGNLDSFDLVSRISLLKETGVRIFFLIGARHHQQAILHEAHKQGIAGTGDHNWIISDDLRAYGEYLPSSTEASVIPGLLKYKVVLTKSGVGRYDAFHSAWNTLARSSMDLEFLDDKLPKHENDTFSTRMTPSDFEVMLPSVPLFYDATVLIGLAACSIGETGLTGPEHFAALLNTSFVGASGPLQLDPTTGSRPSAMSMFAISTHVPLNLENGTISFMTREVAEYEDGEWTIVGDNFFNDKTSNVPLDLKPLETEYNRISGKLRATGLALTLVVVLTSAAAVVWTCTNQASRVVKASQPLFLHLICFGTLQSCQLEELLTPDFIGAALMGLSTVPLAIDDSVVDDPSFACLAYPILMALGWCFTLTALYSKTRLVNKIFHRPAFTVLVIRKVDILSPMALLLGVNIAILVVWSIYAPFRWVRKPIDEDQFGRIVETVGVCECLGTQNLYWIALAMVNGSVLIFTLHQAFVARKIATEFAESEFISQTMCFILCISFVACPVMVMVHRDPRAFYFVRIAHSFVTSMSVILFLFVPKIIYLRKFGNAGYRRAVMDTVRRLQERDTREYGRESHSEVGPLVLDHPKLRLQQDSEYERLVARNRELEVQLAELRSPEQGQQQMSANDSDDLDNERGSDESEVSRSSETLRAYLRNIYG